MQNDNLIDWFTEHNYQCLSDTGKSWEEVGKMFSLSAAAAKSKFRRWQQKQKLELVKEVYKNDEILFSTFKKVNETKELDLSGFDIKKVSENNQGVQWITYENNKSELDLTHIQKVLDSLEFPDLVIKERNDKLSGFKIINISDVHIGMSAKGIFNLKYQIDEIRNRFEKMLEYCKSDVLVVNMLGDYTDGLSGMTNRKKHKLEQNLTNEEMFKYGLDFALLFITNARTVCNHIIVNWLTDSNHSPFIDYSIGYSISKLFENDESVDVNLITDFISTQSYEIDDKRFDFILTHGYDSNLMMKPMPRNFSDYDINFINKIIKSNDLRGKITLLRGDQHRYHDISYESFRDIMSPSLAPPSGWAQINFGSNYNGGFTIIEIDNNCLFSKLIEF